MKGTKGRTARPHRYPLLVLAAVAAVLASLLAVPASSSAQPATRAAEVRHTVTYDRHSLKIDNERVLLRGAEFHYFRLPSPDLWRDILEKYRAAGFNTVSLYFNWSYHSPAPGTYDFSGVRDIDRLLRTVREVGLHAVVRPGPYINAEVSGGGFPGWLKTVDGRARSSDPGYTAAYREWMTTVNKILARHQATRGGPIVLYNVENEYAANTDAQYMQDLQDLARADGIDVPITHNQCCDASWTPTWAEGLGAVQIPGVDDYPQSFDCANAETTWGPWGEGRTERLSENAPVYAAEYQGGAIDVGDAGFDRCRELTGTAFMKYFYKSNLITSGATMFSYYMGFGGTSWGWLPQPNDGYTSYDYGAAITEARQPTVKYDEFKLQNYFLAAARPLTKTDPADAPATGSDALEAVARANPDDGTQFVLVRHKDRAATSDDSGTLDWTTPDGRYSLPVRVNGRDAKVLVGGYDLGDQRLAATTSEVMTHLTTGGRDIAVLYGRDGERAATVLKYDRKPKVRVLDGSATSAWDAATGDLRLDYAHKGLTRVLVTDGGRRPLLLLLGTDATAARFWQADTAHGPVLVRGTDLLREAQVRGGTLHLRADTAKAGQVEVFGPARRLTVGGQPVAVRPTASGSLVGTVRGAKPVTLPELTGWRVRSEAPEAAPAFDDSRWTKAEKTTTASPIKPKTLPVLYADEYGYHYGNVWYRGHFTANGSETSVDLNAVTGKRGVYQVWLNGRHLGSAKGGTQSDSEPVNPDPGPGHFEIPKGLLKKGERATVAVLVPNMGHNDNWTADDTRFKQPRGLVGASVAGADSPIEWRIQGALGGGELTDPVRGPMNTGGLYGERSGWHLPGYADRSWRPGSPATTEVAPGVTWQRTTFRLDLPKGQDTSVALRFGGGFDQRARVMIFVNGWNLGQFGGDIGPQRDFVLPAGILRGHGTNTLALAVVAQDEATVGPVSLVTVAAQRGGVPVRDVPSPGYAALRPAMTGAAS
ncbi:beta-galactosidase [Streptomyces capparidis]